MKQLSLLFLAVLVSVLVFGQTDSLLHWQTRSRKVSDGVYELVARTSIPKGWHVYGTNPKVEGLDPVKFVPAYENAVLQDQIAYGSKPVSIEDPLFSKVDVFTGQLEIRQQVKISGFVPAMLKGTINASLAKADEFIVSEQPFEVTLEGGAVTAATTTQIKIPAIELDKPAADCGKSSVVSGSGLGSIFLLGFLGGLIALLTPCVFPMIPVTVSFFTKRASSRKHAIKNGAVYGFFIFLIYLLASVPFHVLGNVQPEIFNNISTNSWLNVIFFVIFIFFAISFFGYFELTLPSGIASKADSKSGLGSMGGIFFMALTLAIVSFSCTGPILGSLLVGSLSGGAWQLTSGLAGFGLALALPFALFAIFPDWLQSLPKSGGWLDTVKKILAFVEVALAFKFLSNADLVMHWGLLKREVFIGIWILIGAGLTLYLFGILRLPHDYKGMKIGAGRKALGVLALLFTLYLLPGVTQTQYANLRLLSGFPPPLSYSIYGQNNVHGKGLEANVVNDYDKALALSKEQNKPILIDFTGWACVNCRKMEENVWTNPDVYNYIRENYILVSLYVDDRKKLPAEQRILNYRTKTGDSKDIITIGDKWATFEAENFNQTTQPLYGILNTREQLMNHPVGYTPDAAEYLKWLQCGKEAFDRSR
ncbi:MAG: thioredoxin family protein [Chitinophagaceae bacterium]|nr:thioredoxin family protein [Chitinophagaceae bacterium]MCA6455876.1 thioredoxin family protein [Chitinophagaceae bacterium]MCA6458224.1 thioredoxin family protein [Chitinophagaceae bacterium]MCA6463936.1 thioredoxin family protein [Chitinophagaceae bacterium]